MNEQKRTPETTIATLDLGSSCLLTLTNKHLRGQILRLINEDGKSPKTIKDQVDVLLSGIAGYTLEHEDNAAKRIAAVILGILLAAGGIYVGSKMTTYGYWGIAAGALWALIGWFGNPDTYCFALNIMGSKTLIPVVHSYYEAAKDFIDKLRNAKIAYDEVNG